MTITSMASEQTIAIRKFMLKGMATGAAMIFPQWSVNNCVSEDNSSLLFIEKTEHNFNNFTDLMNDDVKESLL